MCVSGSKHEPQDKNHTITYSEVKPLVKHVLINMNISLGMHYCHVIRVVINEN